MKKLLIIGICLLIYSPLFSQSQNDTAKIHGPLLWLNGRTLSDREFRKLLKDSPSNSKAYREMKISRNYYYAGAPCAFIAGAALTAWPFAVIISHGNPSWGFAGVGAGLLLAGFPLMKASIKHREKGVRIYNEGLKQVGMTKLDFKLGMTCNGPGMQITF